MNLFTSSQMPLDQYVTDRPWFVEGRTVPMDDQTCPPHRLEEVRSNLGDDVATLYQARWGSIRSHFWETLRGVRSVYNFRTPIDCTMQDLKAFLRSVALRCTLPFKANIAVSSILRAKKPDDSGNQIIRFFHGSEQNGALFEIPRIITKVEDIEDIAWDIGSGQTPDALDVESEAWSRVVMTSVAVFVHHLTLGGPTGKETNPDTQQKVSNLLQRRHSVIHIMSVYNGICMSIIMNLSARRHECVILFQAWRPDGGIRRRQSLHVSMLGSIQWKLRWKSPGQDGSRPTVPS